jgi:hypothetical protein
MTEKLKTFWNSNIRSRHHIVAFLGIGVLLIFIAWTLGAVLSTTLPRYASQPLASVSSVDPNNPYPNDKGEVLAAQTNSDPHITAVPGQTIQQRYVLKDGDVQPIFIFVTQYPKFIGETNIAGATVYLDIYGTNHVTGNTKIDANGNWEWQANVPIQPGTYIFNVRALDPDTREELAKDSMLFEVVLSKNEIPEKVTLNNTPQLDNNGNLFDVRVSIPFTSKTIKPGEELPADIRLVNIGTPTKAVDVEVQYTIRNQDDDIVSEQSETVAVKKELTYSKSFFTSSSLPDGNYKLTVAIPSRDLIATASDIFKIQKTPIEEQKDKKIPFLGINNVMIEIVGAIIFLGVLIGYMEFTRVTTLSQHIRKIAGKEVLR